MAKKGNRRAYLLTTCKEYSPQTLNGILINATMKYFIHERGYDAELGYSAGTFFTL